ncbi:hypothetical protein E2P84_41355 [Burkholderia cepacia]|uniref:DUF997 family protein n=1 Tax=Burkholderia cepacia TaxID=292 RepID=A0AAX2R9C7_BURCE|nr:MULTISPECIES: hypothetical protein [Burkholderia cepacia complex]MDN7902253.1 hypothetical protein [Burkholderia cepacia]TES62585.1 hypothetical protein E2P84_41355 [Burkholderia cepacia]TES95742.1 hypothetical protein E3D36_37790 [Burkholderia cepacia]TEU31705.1 hypothetical protein E3D37_44510 [Burkholderia cepacia]TEU34108.1 hypothetical protein E3D38_43775 [Burkholderia cepacia]
MDEVDNRTFKQRWLSLTVGVWCWLAPVAVVVCVAAKLASAESTESMPWGAIIVGPAIAVAPGIATFCAWLTFMTHRWDWHDQENKESK